MLRLAIISLIFYIFLTGVTVYAQSSTNYTLEEYTLNNGGDPGEGGVPNSPNYQISHDAIGDSLPGHTLSSASFSIEGGIVSMNKLPGEVLNLNISKVAGVTTLQWDLEPSIGDYIVYRGELSDLPTVYGTAVATGISGETYEDTSTYNGELYFYLVTARNRLAEEGTKGKESGGTERP